MARKGKELSNDAKQMAVDLLLQGYKAAKVAQMLSVNRSTIGRIWKKFKTNESVENKKRSGRPRLVDERGDRKLFRLLRRNRRQSLHDLTDDFNKVTPTKVSKRTVQRRLHSAGYKNRKIRKAITISEVNRKRRLLWCRARRFYKLSYWKKVIFSDETMVVIGKKKSIHVWRKSSEKWNPECLNVLKDPKTIKCMFWGCISKDGVGTLEPIDGNINSEKYIECLDDNLWPVVNKVFGAEPYIFQDDNATPHRSVVTRQWKEENGISTMDWPPQSPDLNIIENLWLTIKIRLEKKLTEIKSRDDLVRAVKKIWHQLSRVYINSLYASIPRRIRQVIMRKGYITKY